MTFATHDELGDAVSLYALGALSGAERDEVEAHLGTCEPCRRDLTAFRPVVDGLARAAPYREPPAVLRTRILESIGGEPGTRPMVSGGVRATTAWPAWLTAAAALIVAAGLGVYAAGLRRQVLEIERQLTVALARAEAAERSGGEARRVAFEAQSMVGVLAAPDLTRIELAGQPAAPSARGRVFWSRSRGLVFTATNLPALPPGRIYQLWVVTADAPVSAGLVAPDATGRATAVVETPANLGAPAAMAVTIEPAGGVPAPTGDRYLVGLVGAAGL
jgi:anti-sigma-K factor RskA